MPVAAYVPPGQCVFPEDDWAPAPLLSRDSVTHNTILLTFGVSEDRPLGLSTCACILAKLGDVVRPYTPVSTNAMAGAFELLVKVYPDGNGSKHLSNLAIGEEVLFKHIPFNVKIQYPFPAKHITMLVGGTGVTPMVQALHCILGTEGDDTTVTMLYGSRTQEDALCWETLDAWQAAFPDRLKVVHVLSHEPEGSSWEGERGFISKELIEQHSPAPSDNHMVFLCGPPPMYAALAGARDQEELTGLLKDMGFAKESVVKF